MSSKGGAIVLKTGFLIFFYAGIFFTISVDFVKLIPYRGLPSLVIQMSKG